MANYGLLALCIGAPIVVGGLNSIATRKSIRTWYPTIAKPSWTPPNWLFAPVWTVLYVMMGVAAWRVIGTGLGRPVVLLATILFVVQLLLNASWSPTFFGAQDPPKALVVLLAMDVAIIATVAVFWTIDTTAALLMLPYLAWGLFATALNIEIVRLNR
mgnify:CR=1 FL=1